MKQHSELHKWLCCLFAWVSFAGFMAAVPGCIPVKLVADYDEVLEESISTFQRTMEGHLVKLERQIGTSAADYSNYVAFYDDAKVALSAVRVRAAARPQNEITLQQIDLLVENLEILEAMHKEGINFNDILPLRNTFNQGCTAILKLEFEKKRNRNI